MKTVRFPETGGMAGRVPRILAMLPAVGSFFAASLSAGTDASFLNWERLPDPPFHETMEGVFAGEHNGALLVAGGRETATGELSESIHILEQNGDGQPVWVEGWRLPEPLADAGVVVTPHGLLVAGGTRPDGVSSRVYLLFWDGENQIVRKRDLSPLPLPVVSPPVGFHLGVAWVVGSGNALHRLDLEAALSGDENAGWREMGRLPGPIRTAGTSAVLSDGERHFWMVVGGVLPGGEPAVDGHQFGPLTGPHRNWTAVADAPGRLSGAVRWGTAHALALGASDERGIDWRVFSYHSITDTWTDRGRTPVDTPPIAVARWGEKFVVIAPADDGGVAVFSGAAIRVDRWFGALDYGALGLYLTGLVALGAWCSRRNRGTADYFLAGRRIPAWAAALSLMATSVSSIGFIAIPGKTFATDWLYFSGILTWFVVVPIVTIFLIPALRNLNVTTAYEYLETRFNLPVRLFAGLLFILMQVGRLAIVLYLPALVLSSVIGLDIYLCIAAMGVVSILYTVLGGMEAVVWTDVVQVIVLFGGALLGIGIALAGTGMGAADLWQTAWGDGKLRVADWRWDHTAAVFWVVIVGTIFTRFSNLSSDQSIVQRYLTTPDTRSAVRALWGDVAVSIPWAFVAFALGTALYLFYKANPGFLLPGTEADSVVPVFIAQQMPAGVAGLIIAAIFAAAMSSLDSTIHSLSTVCVRDFYGRLSKRATEAREFFVARWLTVFFGLIGTLAAMGIAAYDVKSLWDLFIRIMGLFVGSLSGLFVMGLFLKRCHGGGALAGALASAVAVYMVSAFTPVHFFLFPVVGVITCVGAGFLASLIIPERRDLPVAS